MKMNLTAEHIFLCWMASHQDSIWQRQKATRNWPLAVAWSKFDWSHILLLQRWNNELWSGIDKHPLSLITLGQSFWEQLYIQFCLKQEACETMEWTKTSVFNYSFRKISVGKFHHRNDMDLDLFITFCQNAINQTKRYKPKRYKLNQWLSLMKFNRSEGDTLSVL